MSGEVETDHSKVIITVEETYQSIDPFEFH